MKHANKIPYPRKRFMRVIVYITGLLLLSIGFSWIILAGKGSDPTSMMAQGLSIVFHITIGRGSQLLNGTAVVLVFFLNRKLLRPGTAVSALGIGVLLDLFLALFPSPSGIWSWLCLVAGIVLGGCGIALTVISGCGVSPLDCITQLFGRHMGMARVVMDFLFLIGGCFMGANPGLGTVAAALFMGGVVSLFLSFFSEKTVDKTTHSV